MEFIFLFVVLPKICFSRFLLRFVLQLSIKKFSKFCELLFPKKPFSSSCKIFTLEALQYIYRTADYGLRKPQMPRVSNGNLIVLKQQNIHVISNIKYTAIYIFSKTWPSSYIQQKHIQSPFQRLSKEVFSLEVTTVTKKSIIDV